MFTRLTNVIKAFLNKLLGKVEDPVMLLETHIRELQALIPSLNKSVATSQAAVIAIQKELAKLQGDNADYDNKIQAALQVGEEDYARSIVVKMQANTARIDRLKEDLEMAQKNLNQVQQVRDLRVKEIKQKQEEVRGKIDEHKFSKMQSSVAQALDSSVSIDPYSLSSQVDDQLRKLEEETNINQATFAASLSNSKDSITTMRVESKAQEIEANRLLDSYKQKMGLTGSSSSSSNLNSNSSSSSTDGGQTVDAT